MTTTVHEGPTGSAERRRWVPGDYSDAELADGLVQARVAGPVTSHDRANVRSKIERLIAGDPDLQFGIEGLAGAMSVEAVTGLMAEAAGFNPDPSIVEGPTPIDPWKVLAASGAAGERLAVAAGRGELVVCATGHPVGLILLYGAVGRLLERGGAKLARPMEGGAWWEGGRREIRYLNGVAVLTDRASSLHTHAPGPMRRMLEEVRPDLVLADHGFAGAAIQAGVETISVVDVNDPAPVVARAMGRTELIVAMDDNVQPAGYWPCFQAIARRFDGSPAA